MHLKKRLVQRIINLKRVAKHLTEPKIQVGIIMKKKTVEDTLLIETGNIYLEILRDEDTENVMMTTREKGDIREREQIAKR